MNIQPSERLQHVQEYYFSKKLAEIRKLISNGVSILNLGIGNPDMPTHPRVTEALYTYAKQSGSNFYQPYNGISELRLAFSDWYKSVYKVNLNPETDILPLIGSKEGIMHISMAFTNSGDQVLIPNPGYPAYSSVSKLLNLKIDQYNLSEAKNWLPDINELEKIALSNCKLLWLNYPHMPTGATINKKHLEKILEWAKEQNILVVNDNPYSLILNENPLSILSVAKEYSHVLELNSLSKSHNMAGWRVGMVAGGEVNIKTILQVKSNFDSGMYKPIQKAATAALQLSDNWYQKINKEYSERRKKVWDILDYFGCTYQKNTAGLFVWAKIPDFYSSSEEFSDHLLYEHGLFLTPGKVFGSNGKKYVRVSLCAPVESLEKKLSELTKSEKINYLKN